MDEIKHLLEALGKDERKEILEYLSKKEERFLFLQKDHEALLESTHQLVKILNQRAAVHDKGMPEPGDENIAGQVASVNPETAVPMDVLLQLEENLKKAEQHIQNLEKECEQYQKTNLELKKSLQDSYGNNLALEQQVQDLMEQNKQLQLSLDRFVSLLKL